MLRFILLTLMSRAFWKLYLATFTIVLMVAWRSSLRDQIFAAASALKD